MTDVEGWEWLVKIRENKRNEFRIHTNKDGIRLYLKILDRDLCGISKYYYNFSSIGHREVYELRPNYYINTVVKPSLGECVLYHIEHFKGKDFVLDNWRFVEFQGTAEEFVSEYNQTQQKFRRNPYHNLDYKTIKERIDDFQRV